MKKIVLTGIMMMAMVGSMSVKAADTNKSAGTYEVSFTRLSKYLNLNDDQRASVYDINEFFKNEQESLDVTKDKALKHNLKLMKNVLSKEQYRKYLTLLNVTSSNRQQTAKAKTATTAASGFLASSK